MQDYDNIKYNMNIQFRDNFTRVNDICFTLLRLDIFFELRNYIILESYTNIINNVNVALEDFRQSLVYLSNRYESFKRMHGELIACDNIELCIFELNNICINFCNIFFMLFDKNYMTNDFDFFDTDTGIKLKFYYNELSNIIN